MWKQVVTGETELGATHNCSDVGLFEWILFFQKWCLGHQRNKISHFGWLDDHWSQFQANDTKLKLRSCTIQPEIPKLVHIGDDIRVWQRWYLIQMYRAICKEWKGINFSPNLNIYKRVHFVPKSLMYICLTSVTRVKWGVHSTLCWKVGNISGST